MYTLAEIIERLSKSMQDHEASVTKQSMFSNLSVTQIHYLDAIRHLDSPTSTKLAEYLKVSKPTITIALNKLESKGYVTKVSSKDDHRVSYVHLTKKGLKISDLHDEIHKGYAVYFENSLDKKELQTIVMLLNKVLADLGL